MIEVDLSRAIWRKSSRSGSGNACVEVTSVDHVVMIRDSKNPTGPKLAFGPTAWRELSQRIIANEHDL